MQFNFAMTMFRLHILPCATYSNIKANKIIFDKTTDAKYVTPPGDSRATLLKFSDNYRIFWMFESLGVLWYLDPLDQEDNLLQKCDIARK